MFPTTFVMIVAGCEDDAVDVEERLELEDTPRVLGFGFDFDLDCVCFNNSFFRASRFC